MNISFKIYEKKEEFGNFSEPETYCINFLYTCVLLLPLFLLTGPFLPDLVIVFCTLFFLYLITKYRIKSYFQNFFFKIFLFFWIYIILVSLTSENIIFSLKSSVFYFRFVIFSLFVLFLIKNYKFFVKIFFNIFTITLFIVLVDSYYQFYFGISLSGFEKPDLRLTGPFDDRQIVGSFISRTLPLYLFLFFFLYKKMNIKMLTFMFLLSVLVLFSGERTAFFILSFFIIATFFLYNQNIIKFLSFFVIYILISLIIVFSVPSLKVRIIEQTLGSFAIKNYINDDGSKEYFKDKPKRGFYIFSKAHEVHYLTAYKMFKENLILGLGPNMFRKKCADSKYFIEQSSCTTHPHNFLLQLLAETGMFGSLFYFLLFFLILKKILSLLYETKFQKKNLSNNKFNIYILNLGFLINSFMFVLPSGNFFNNYLNAIIFIPVGFYLFQIENDE